MDGIDHTPQSPGQVNGSITPRLGSLQSGSSKRKSRPVKRIVQDEEDADDVGGGLAMASQPSDTLLESAHPLPAYNDDENLQREEDDTAASEVLSTGSDEASMDQPMNTLTNSDILRRFAEAIAANQAAQANSKNFNHGTSFEEAKKSGSPLTNGSAAAATSIASQIAQLSPLFPNTEVLQSSERLLQTVFNPSLSLGLSQNIQALVTSSHVNNILTTPLINQANQALFHTIMAAVKKQQESRPTTNGSKGTKRRLFSDDERARAEAAAKGEERIDMSDLEEFAQTFKKQRIKFGFTQGDVGVALGKRYGTDFSQTTISRFEALNLSFKNMCKLRPLLKEWLADIETAIESGATLTDLIERRVSSSTTSPSSEPTPIAMLEASSESSTPLPTPTSGSRSDPHMKRRRKRTNLDVNQRSALDSYFAINPRPDHDKMTDIANSLELERDVVRVWFCNRRQKMRRVDEPTDSETTSAPFTTLEQLKEATKLVCAKEPHDVIPTSEAVVMDES